jgi:hypothetical protein
LKGQALTGIMSVESYVFGPYPAMPKTLSGTNFCNISIVKKLSMNIPLTGMLTTFIPALLGRYPRTNFPEALGSRERFITVLPRRYAGKEFHEIQNFLPSITCQKL